MNDSIIISTDTPECKNCSRYKTCDEKRKMMCVQYMPYLSMTSQSTTTPNANELCVKHDYRDIKIDTNATITIDLEEVKKNLTKELYKSFECPFTNYGA